MKKTFNGVVHRRTVHGTNRTLLALQTEGKQYALRVSGIPAATEPAALSQFVGKNVEVEGFIRNKELYVGNIQFKK